MDDVYGSKTSGYVFCPSIGYTFKIIPIIFARSRTNSPTRLFNIVKTGCWVKTHLRGPIPRTPRSGKNKLVIKCGNLTVSVFWFSLENGPTVSRDDESIFRYMKDDNRPSADLGRRRIRKESNNAKNQSFHCALHSGFTKDNNLSPAFHLKEQHTRFTGASCAYTESRLVANRTFDVLGSETPVNGSSRVPPLSATTATIR